MNFDIIFVILNYNVLKETIDCISSIKKNIDTSRYHIVVVDNNSNNGIGQKLQSIYENDDKIEIHILDQNYGFAKGNNLGVAYAKEYNPNYIICMNNDILFLQKDFFTTLTRITRSQDENIAVIGPRIYTRYGDVQRVKKELKTIDEYYDELKYYQSRVDQVKNVVSNKKNKYPAIIYPFRKIGLKIRTKVRLLTTLNKHFDLMPDVVLHGCFLVFTKKWFEGRQKVFDDRTFLYNEEELLYINVKRSNLKTLYYPDLKILHLEDVSTDASFSDRGMIAGIKVDSLKILIKEMEKCGL